MKRILVATDGSPSSTEAVAFGVELATEHEAELIFVHVVPTLDIVPATGFGGISGAFPHEPSEHDHGCSKMRLRWPPSTASSRRPRCSVATPSTRSSPTPTRMTST